MSFLDKIKDLFTDEEEIIETKEVEVEEHEEHKLPTFMRNKIEEEQKREEAKKEKDEEIPIDIVSDREIVKTRSESNFSFPIEMDEPEVVKRPIYSNQNVLHKEREKEKEKNSSIADLYSKKEEPKPKRFRPTPVISPVYGVLDKNYTKDEVKVQDENSYEIQRPSRKVDFETVRNKAFGSLTDDIRDNLCESCELYQEVKITKNVDKKNKEAELLNDIMEDSTSSDISLGDAEDNYFDFGVDYEVPRRDESTIINADKVEVEINNDIKIVNHNDEESVAEKIELKEEKTNTKKASKKKEIEEFDDKLLEDTKEFEKLMHDEEDINSILGSDDDSIDSDTNDIFNLIDSMYDEEDN